MKKGKGIKQFHTSSDKTGSGDNYGSGIKNPIGKIRSVYAIDSIPSSNKNIEKPPKSLA